MLAPVARGSQSSKAIQFGAGKSLTFAAVQRLLEGVLNVGGKNGGKNGASKVGGKNGGKNGVTPKVGGKNGVTVVEQVAPEAFVLQESTVIQGLAGLATLFAVHKRSPDKNAS